LVHNKRGRAVIINNKVFFDGKTPKREGAERDLEDLKKLFENLFFIVQVHENKSAEVCSSFCRSRSLIAAYFWRHWVAKRFGAFII
jgi:hypothetical protein